MDVHLAIKLLRWIRAISCEPDRPDLVVHYSAALDAREEWRLRDAAKALEPMFSVFLNRYEIDEVGYFGTPNRVFKAALEFIERTFSDQPMLWVEADCVPMHPTWYSAIADEYGTCGRPFMGDHVIAGQTIPHQTGNAVYPANWRKLAPSLAALPGPDPKHGWDSMCAYETLPQSHCSTTIRQVWRPEKFTAANWTKVVPKDAALFHQCKDGSLIDVLAELEGMPGTPIPLDLPSAESTYEAQLASTRTPQNLGAVEIMVVSCLRDAGFLKYCLEALKKYAKGFAGITVVVPEHEVGQMGWIMEYGVRSVVGNREPEGKGMLAHEVAIMRADEICPNAAAILHVDSDVIAWKEFTPADLAPQGCPIIVREPYWACGVRNPNRLLWQKTVQAAIGITPESCFMVRHPYMYHRDTYQRARTMIEAHTGQKCDECILSGQNTFPQSFAEYPTLGTVAAKFQASRYTWVDYDQAADRKRFGIPHDNFQYIYDPKRDSFCELWSHGGVQRYEADMRNFIAGMRPAYYMK